MNQPPLQLFGSGQPGAAASDQDNVTRQQYYRCEKGIRMVGYLYVLTGLCMLVPGVLFMTMMMDGRPNAEAMSLWIPMIAGGAIGIVHGIALYRLNPWARAIGVVLTVFGLLSTGANVAIAFLVLLQSVDAPRGHTLMPAALVTICLGTVGFVISARIFTLLRSQEAKSVCTEWYASVVARTERPKLSSGRSAGATWIFLLAVAILVGALAFFIVYPVK